MMLSILTSIRLSVLPLACHGAGSLYLVGFIWWGEVTTDGIAIGTMDGMGSDRWGYGYWCGRSTDHWPYTKPEIIERQLQLKT